MQKKLVLFYPKKEIMDMRVERIESAAVKNGLLVEKLCIHDLLFTNSKIFNDGEEVVFDKNNLHWVVSFPYASRNLSYILKLQDISLYPLLHNVVYDLDDKFTAHCFFNAHNIPTLKTTWLETQTVQKSIDFLGGFPLIIKTTLGSAGRAVEIVRSEDDIAQFITSQLKPGKTTFTKKLSYILQEYVAENNGEDYRVLCIKDEVLGIIKRTAAHGGFKSNVSLGGSVLHIKSHPEMEDLAKKVMEKSGLFMGGIDFIDTKDGLKAIEINASPQFEGFEKATGINVADHIIKKLLEEK